MCLPTSDLQNLFSADDWGLSPSVNAAILELAQLGLIRSVSILANLPYWREGLKELGRTSVALSAHLNFTLGRPLACDVSSLVDSSGELHRFSVFFSRGIFGRLVPEELAAEAGAQLRQLRTECNIVSVDGHQHVHLLPWTVDPILSAAKAAGVRKIRFMDDRSHPPSWLAARWSARKLRRAWPEMELERTLYLWPTGKWNVAGLRRKATEASGRALLVHPAARDDFADLEFADGLRAQRVVEFEKLRKLEV